MQFGQPYYFNLLWLVPLLIFFYAWAARKKCQLTNQFCSPETAAKLISLKSEAKQRLKFTLLVFAVTCLIIALTHPRWGFKWEELRQEGVDIIIVIDHAEYNELFSPFLICGLSLLLMEIVLANTRLRRIP